MSLKSGRDPRHTGSLKGTLFEVLVQDGLAENVVADPSRGSKLSVESRSGSSLKYLSIIRELSTFPAQKVRCSYSGYNVERPPTFRFFIRLEVSSIIDFS